MKWSILAPSFLRLSFPQPKTFSFTHLQCLQCLHAKSDTILPFFSRFEERRRKRDVDSPPTNSLSAFTWDKELFPCPNVSSLRWKLIFHSLLPLIYLLLSLLESAWISPFIILQNPSWLCIKGKPINSFPFLLKKVSHTLLKTFLSHFFFLPFLVKGIFWFICSD